MRHAKIVLHLHLGVRVVIGHALFVINAKDYSTWRKEHEWSGCIYNMKYGQVIP